MIPNGNYRIVKPMVWRRSDLEGRLANGKHNFRKKSMFGQRKRTCGQRSNRFREEMKRFCCEYSCEFSKVDDYKWYLSNRLKF